MRIIDFLVVRGIVTALRYNADWRIVSHYILSFWLLQVFRSAIRWEEAQGPAWELFSFPRLGKSIQIEWCLLFLCFRHQKFQILLSSHTMPPYLFISSWRTLTNVWCSTMRLFMTSASVPWNLPLPPVSPSSFSRNPYSHILTILFIHWMWRVWSLLRQITVCASAIWLLSLLFTKSQSLHPLVCTHDYQLELVSCQKLDGSRKTNSWFICGCDLCKFNIWCTISSWLRLLDCLTKSQYKG